MNRTTKAALALAVGALALQACGSDDDDDAGSVTEPDNAPSGSTSEQGSTEQGSTAAGTGAAGESFEMAGLYANTSDAFWLTFKCGSMKRADELGVDLKTSEIATWDAAQYSTLLDTALIEEPDAVLFNPIDVTPFSAKVKEIMDSGVPVVTPLALDPETQLTYTIANQDGSKHSPLVIEALEGKEGSAVVLKGLEDAPWQHERLDGMIAAVEEARPDLTWLEDQVDGFDVTKGTQMISSLLVANPDLQLILAVAGPEGQAAAAAVAQSDRAGDIVVVAFDAVPAEVDALRNGDITFLVAQPAEALGAASVQSAYDYLSANGAQTGEAVEPIGPQTELELGLLTQENVNDPANQGLIYSATCDA